eukprot:6202506-Pleurochrysis_carterae.AAC.2
MHGNHERKSGLSARAPPRLPVGKCMRTLADVHARRRTHPYSDVHGRVQWQVDESKRGSGLDNLGSGLNDSGEWTRLIG